MKLVLLALGLGLVASADGSHSTLQQRALNVVLEDFHSKPQVVFAFKEEAVMEVLETEFPRGTFVRMEVDLVQTSCRKQQRETQNCPIKRGGRKQKCLACFKFDSQNAADVLDQSVRCMVEKHPHFQVMKERQERDCEAVRDAFEEHYRPGVFAFSRSQRSPHDGIHMDWALQ